LGHTFKSDLLDMVWPTQFVLWFSPGKYSIYIILCCQFCMELV
jgi:hypothetical protein